MMTKKAYMFATQAELKRASVLCLGTGPVFPVSALGCVLDDNALMLQAFSDVVGQGVLLGLSKFGAGVEQQLDERPSDQTLV